MKTVALVELNWQGHHAVYFKVMTQTLLELGYQVVALCPYPSEVEEWIVSQVPNRIDSLYCCEIREEEDKIPAIKQAWLKRRLNLLIKTKPLLMVIRRWHQVAACLHTASSKFGLTVDFVFFAYLDSYMGSHLARYVLDYIFPYQWSGFYVAPFHLRAIAPSALPTKQGSKFIRRKPHALLLSPNCRSVAVVDEGVADKLQASIDAKPVIVFPEFTDTSQPDREYELAKQIKEKARGKRIISLIGSLVKRKGMLRMLEVSQAVQDENYFFVFVGGFIEGSFPSEELTKIKSIVNSKPSNCLFHFELIPDEPKYNFLIEVSDVLWLVYDFPHGSQTLTKAAFFEKPVLASKDTCAGERVQKYQMGISVDKDSTLECVDALRKLNSQLNNSEAIQPDYEAYRHIHSIEQFEFQFKTILSLAIQDNALTKHR